MNVTVNGAPQEVPEGETLEAVVARLGMAAGPAATEVNRRLVTKRERPGTVLHEGDRVEVVTLVGGG